MSQHEWDEFRRMLFTLLLKIIAALFLFITKKNHTGLNLFAITVHITCNPVLTTWAKHCLQSGTCLLWEMVGCDMALLVEISYLSHIMSCSSYSFTLLQLAFLFWFISLEKKRIKRDWSFCLHSHPIALKGLSCCWRDRGRLCQISPGPETHGYMNIWPVQTFINITAGLRLVLEDWFDLILHTDVVFK